MRRNNMLRSIAVIAIFSSVLFVQGCGDSFGADSFQFGSGGGTPETSNSDDKDRY